MPYHFNITPTIAVVLASILSCYEARGQNRISRSPMAGGYASPDGVLEPWKISDVASGESGIVESIQVKLGDFVRVGDPLATIDCSGVRIQLAIAEAQAAAVGRQSAARAEMELNERIVKAIADARVNRYSSQSELERAQAELQIARSRVAAELEDQEVLRLQVARLLQQIKQRTVTAPINGIVVELHKELGEFVSPTTPEVMRIVDVSRLRASFFLQVHEVAGLSQDERVLVELDGGERTKAAVEHISPVADGESGLIEVRVLIDNPQMRILGSRCTLLLTGGDAAGRPVSRRSN